MYYLKRKRKEGRGTPGRTALVRKLDRVFSLYIRKRDSAPWGGKFFRCISCGRVMPYAQGDCGHFFSRRHMSTRFDEDNCHMECRYCLTPDALILTDMLEWVPLGEMKEGQKLFAFEEGVAGANKRRLYRTGKVTHLHRDVQDVYRVTLENGDHVDTTADHEWLVRDRGSGMKWMKTKDMWCHGKRLNGHNKTGPHWGEVSTTVCKLINLVYHDESSESGWLAGMIDADGHLCQQNIFEGNKVRYGFRIGVAQSEHYPDIGKRIKELITKFTDNGKFCTQRIDLPRGPLRSNYDTYQYLVTGTNMEKVQFLQRVRPMKMAKLDINKLGSIKSQYDTKVRSIEYMGKKEIVVMETDTHTFIANGYAMHNCNRFSADHLIGYREGLIRKIGRRRFDLLDVKRSMTKKWSAFELEQLIEYYGILTR